MAVPHLYRKFLVALLLLLGLLTTLFCAYKSRDTLYHIPSKSTKVYLPSDNIINRSTWLTGHNFTYPFEYAYREIVTRETAEFDSSSITKIGAPLFDTLRTIDSIERLTEAVSPSLPPLVLTVPSFAKPPVDASHILFGIQTTRKRLEDSIQYLQRWLPHTGARLYVLVIESELDAELVAADKEQLAALESRMRSLGLDVTLLPAKEGDNFPQRYFSLVNVLYSNRSPKTQWFSLIDDDTFFPSMDGLLAMLAMHDPMQEKYVGSLSEDWWAVSHYGYMGFGGAGVFLSLPLAKVLDAHTHECKNELRSSAGDMAVMDCIYTHSSTKLTHVPELRQVDILGDSSGLYESGRTHLSLHHWKKGGVFEQGYRMDLMHLVADVCGECFLQRWQFSDDVVLSNGYSIARYPNGHLRSGHASRIDMAKMEETWNSGRVTRHSLGPVRPRLLLDKDKIQHSLLDAMFIGQGVRQIYMHKGAAEQPDTILELLWIGDEIL